LLAVLYPAEGNLAPGNLKIAQHLIKGRAGRGLIRVRVSVERHRFPPLQKPVCSCFLSFAALATLISRVGSRFPCAIIAAIEVRRDCRRLLPPVAAHQALAGHSQQARSAGPEAGVVPAAEAAGCAELKCERNPLSSMALGDFPSRRWDQLRSDVTDFLASPWLAEAARLGLDRPDLFGVDADRP